MVIDNAITMIRYDKGDGYNGCDVHDCDEKIHSYCADSLITSTTSVAIFLQ